MKEIFENNFISEVENFTDSIIQKKDVLQLLISEVKKNNSDKLFEELCFTGKYVNGLLRVLKNSTSNPEITNIDDIKNDLSNNMKKVISLLQEITLKSDEAVKKHFEANYFNLSPDTLQNLTILASDLDATKKYINYLKRKS